MAALVKLESGIETVRNSQALEQIAIHPMIDESKRTANELEVAASGEVQECQTFHFL